MSETDVSLSDLVVERVGFGIFVLDREMNVLMWNRFMHDHSGLSAEQVVGKSIFASVNMGVHTEFFRVDVAARRWQDYTGKAAVLAATGSTFEEISEERTSNGTAAFAAAGGGNAEHRG